MSAKVAEAMVLSSRKGCTEGWIETTTDAVRVYPNEVLSLRVEKKVTGQSS